MKPIIEVCCGSVEDVINAQANGAHRVELNSALFLGGLTPTLGTLAKVLEKTEIQVIVMIRCRGAGFTYSMNEIENMYLDAQLLLEKGADGIAFGALTENHSIDIDTTRRFIELTHRYGKEFVFHRAIDCVNDVETAIRQLIDLKVDRILTSGGQAKVVDALNTLSDLQNRYGKRIEILLGGGVHANNAARIIEATQCIQLHSSCKGWTFDPTTRGEHVSYAYGDHESHFDQVDPHLVKQLVIMAENAYDKLHDQ